MHFRSGQDEGGAVICRVGILEPRMLTVGDLFTVQFFERRTTAKRINIWFAPKAEQEVCWEQWVINVTLVNPRTDAGMFTIRLSCSAGLHHHLECITQSFRNRRLIFFLLL